MKVESIELKYFKRFSGAKLCLNSEGFTNVLIGANNSGKTSFVEGVSKFLTPNRSLRIYDFPIENWNELELRFEKILKEKEDEERKANIEKFLQHLPSLKMTILYDLDELHIVKYFLPSLQNQNNKIAFTMRYEPKNMQDLITSYTEFRENLNRKSKELKYDYSEGQGSLNFGTENIIEHYWKEGLQEFLKRDDTLQRYFDFKVYISNPNTSETSQEFPLNENTLIKISYVNELIKVNTISAGRYLSDTDDTGQSINLNIENKEKKSLVSKLLTTYAHTKREGAFNENEIDYLDLNYNLLQGNYETEQQLEEFYLDKLSELLDDFNEWGYPGIHNPNLGVQPKVNLFGSLEQEASILLSTSANSEALLPENYNGLGYRNLLYIYLQLNLFKQEFKISKEAREAYFHLILIEEPEVNLHSPVQRVFIEQVDKMFDSDSQIIVSTHSNHIVDSVKFDQLHYFKVDGNKSEIIYLDDLPLSSTTVGDNNDRFIKKYFELHSHDIFFSDGIIVVEGESEEILIPHFIRNKVKYERLNQKYIAMMRVGGAYANKFLPLFKALNKPTLIITDIDSANQKGEKDFIKKNENQVTSNYTLKSFLQLATEKNQIEILLDLDESNKKQNNIRICYQSKNYGENKFSLYARTFEDAFALKNKKELKEIDFKTDFDVMGRGLLRKFHTIFNEHDETDYVKELFESITNDAKSDLALDIIYYLTSTTKQNATDIFELPIYIDEGLEWLNDKLTKDIQIHEGGGEN